MSIAYHSKALTDDSTASEKRSEELSDEEEDIEPELWSGNRNRKLWKATCVRAALSVSSDTSFYPILAHSLFSQAYLIKNVFSMPLLPQRRRPPQFSNLQTGHGRTTFGLRSALYAKRRLAESFRGWRQLVSGKVAWMWLRKVCRMFQSGRERRKRRHGKKRY